MRKTNIILISIILLILLSINCLAAIISKDNYIISRDSINDIIKIDAFKETYLEIENNRDSSIRVNLELKGNASKIVRLDKSGLTILPNTKESVKITLFGLSAGNFNGTLELSEMNLDIPINVKVYDPDLIPVSALYLEIEPTQEKIHLGRDFKFRVNIYNLLVDKNYNSSLKYSVWVINNQTLNHSVYEREEMIEVKTSDSLIREFTIPKNISTGAYILRIDAKYLNLTSSASTVFFVTIPFYMYKILWFRVWHYLTLFFLIIVFIVGKKYYMKQQEAKKRYHTQFDLKLLPKPGQRSAFLGKIAETEHKAYLNLDNLTTHTIVAGSTGGGKTVAAQDIVEEALLKGIAVVVFDPTAQWSGMLRKSKNKKMLDLFPKFGMKPTDARAFNGNVRDITDAREIIDIKKYLKPGEIQIFSVNKLDPKDIDIFVANTVREIFHANFPEEQELKYMIVYDEVHRLLAKFGGSGEGFIQIERACREFRKWGIGVLLISQVLADFVGQIKANINTEIQLRTRDEGDLKRIETKYGTGLLRSLVKASVGTGMLQNSAYNRGQPYFVTFRPMMHSVKRLSDEELEKYNYFNEIIDDYEYQLEQLEKEGLDVFDMKLELKLSLDKVKSGSFNMVEIYLEGLTSRLKGEWEKLGKQPEKKQISLVDEDALKSELDKAKKERDEFMKGEAKAEKLAEKKQEIVLFEKIFNPVTFDNGAMVSSLQELTDALSSMDGETFQSHVNEKKNDLFEWIKNIVQDDALIKLLEGKLEKVEVVKILKIERKKKRKILAESEQEPKKVSDKPPQELKVEEEKEDPTTKALELVKTIQSSLDSQDIDRAKKQYNSLTEMYKVIPKEGKVKLHNDCVNLHKKIVALELFSSKGV